MFRTFRSRLLLSMLLPFLLIAPILGLALTEIVEERVLLPSLAQEMADQGILIARLGVVLPEIWADPEAAHAFLDALAIRQPTQVLLLDPSGRLLAASGEVPFTPGSPAGGLLFERAQRGEIAWRTTLRGADSDIVMDVLVPVTNDQGTRLGYVRLLRRLPDVVDGLGRVRRLMLGTLAVGLILSSFFGWVLAQSLSRPLQQVTRAIAEAPLEGPAVVLPEIGPQEVRQLVQAFNRLQRRRADLEEARRLLLRSVIHEFGRLIGALRAALHALQGGAIEAPDLRQELLQGMSRATAELTRLLEDMAQLYRHATGPFSLQRRPLALGSWLRAQAALWARMARERSIHWKEEIPPDLPTIQADPERLAHALGNLVDNALKFTPAGGCVTLRVGVRDRELQIRVRDTGPGIPPEDLPRLFEPFYRGSQEGRPGLGLGLFLARMIVEAHGGRLEVESQEGEGSCFMLILPLG